MTIPGFYTDEEQMVRILIDPQAVHDHWLEMNEAQRIVAIFANADSSQELWDRLKVSEFFKEDGDDAA